MLALKKGIFLTNTRPYQRIDKLNEDAKNYCIILATSKFKYRVLLICFLAIINRF